MVDEHISTESTESTERPEGGALLTALAGAMVGIFRECLGKGPNHCKAYWAGADLLVVMLGGGFTVAERTLYESGRGDAVQASRSAIQAAVGDQMREMVEQLTGRKVQALLAASHQAPDLSAEIFVLEPLPSALRAVEG